MPSSYVLGDHFESFIKQQIASGRYNSASEVLRESLRLLEDQESLRQIKLERLRADVLEGINSGPGIPAEEVFASVRKRIADIAAQRGEDDSAYSFEDEN